MTKSHDDPPTHRPILPMAKIVLCAQGDVTEDFVRQHFRKAPLVITVKDEVVSEVRDAVRKVWNAKVTLTQGKDGIDSKMSWRK